METVKPGTRCECQSRSCDCAGHNSPVAEIGRCYSNATVSLSLVHRHRSSPVAKAVFDIELCDGCYRWHSENSTVSPTRACNERGAK